MHEAVEDGVCQGVITDAGVPLVGGQLADHDGGGVAVAVVHNLHQVIALGRFQCFESPVIDNEQLHLGQVPEQLVVAAIDLGLVEFQEQSREAMVSDAVAAQAGTVPEGASEVGFAAAAGTGQQEILPPFDPLSLGEARDLGLGEVAGVLIVDILDGGGELEAGLADQARVFVLFAA